MGNGAAQVLNVVEFAKPALDGFSKTCDAAADDR
ncbi:hypothetical protein EV646_11376 [Kribbella antiqua]|uniref:Uncharacterized protein n=1 Tax=Kribbella antiqua TaxID=2512217 RepID=A0A4R2ID08_9ACTN|nr:hypothetical protein EV646_11376 [Kribbella antiqua]